MDWPHMYKRLTAENSYQGKMEGKQTRGRPIQVDGSTGAIGPTTGGSFIVLID